MGLIAPEVLVRPDAVDHNDKGVAHGQLEAFRRALPPPLKLVVAPSWVANDRMKDG